MRTSIILSHELAKKILAESDETGLSVTAIILNTLYEKYSIARRIEAKKTQKEPIEAPEKPRKKQAEDPGYVMFSKCLGMGEKELNGEVLPYCEIQKAWFADGFRSCVNCSDFKPSGRNV